MNAVLRWTGLPQLYSFYRHLAFNVPRATTGTAALLLGGIAAIHLYWLLSSLMTPAYLAAYFALVVTAALVATVGMLTPGRPLVIKASWALGSLVTTAAFAMYIVSRTAGLPGLEFYIARWDYALGTFTVMLAVAFIGLHFTVLTGVNIAWPQRRDWSE